MQFKERSYSGKLFRPKPMIHFNDQQGLLIVATPWGLRESAEKAINIIQTSFLAAKDDLEATSPFDILTCISSYENSLRTALLFANKSIYEEFNYEEYTTGLEVFAGARILNYFVWTQIGNPSLFLKRNDNIVCLGSQYDLSFDFSLKKRRLPPLPAQMLGIDATLNIKLDSFRVHPNDVLFLLSHSFVNPNFLVHPQIDLNGLSDNIVASDPDHPFWVGQASL